MWNHAKNWFIDYVVGDTIIEAHTHGLNQYNQIELQVRKLDQSSAAYVLNMFGSWVAGGHGKIEDGDTIILGARPEHIPFHAKATRDGSDEPLLRLAWAKDP